MLLFYSAFVKKAKLFAFKDRGRKYHKIFISEQYEGDGQFRTESRKIVSSFHWIGGWTDAVVGMDVVIKNRVSLGNRSTVV